MKAKKLPSEIKEKSKSEISKQKQLLGKNSPAAKKEMPAETTLRNCVELLIYKLKKHKDYRRAWNDNIAMAFKDSYGQHKKKTGKTTMSKEDIHTIANNASEYFLNLLCGQLKYPKGR